MHGAPVDVDADAGPPLAIPLRHFLVALGFLLAGVAVGLGVVAGVASGRSALAAAHLLLVGWVCVTIAGAMTQFVPVWSGVALHSRRLARWQLRLLALGLAGFAGALVADALRLLPVAGALVLAGFWTLAYTIGRSLLAARPGLDRTERHFALALCSLAVVPVLGLVLAADFRWGVLPVAGVTHASVLAAHATLAVFGVVLTTIVGALAQLVPMFTQTDFTARDRVLLRVETGLLAVGVPLLAVGRLLDSYVLALPGGLATLVALAAFTLAVAHRLVDARERLTPMLVRYVVAATALGVWAVVSLPAWLTTPTARVALLGASGAGSTLLLAAVAFVVLGTLYHVVPFLVWVDRYSDQLGFGAVPMVDDLYDDRLERLDLAATVAGAILVLASDALAAITTDAVVPVRVAGFVLLAVGVAVFAVNVLFVVAAHAPDALGALGGLVARRIDPDESA